MSTDMADRVTRYVAREIVRRERLEVALIEPARSGPSRGEGSFGSGMGIVIAAFVIGLITGAAGLFAAVWLSVP